MIWFACRQCGKAHGRPENSVGSMIFCDCGQALTVPWESTIEEPAVVLPAEPVESPGPRMIPVPVGEERVPVVRPARPPEAPGRRTYAGRRLQTVTPRDRNFCFNHQEFPSERTCDSCTERFCASCLVLFQGKVLCGPCKNAHVKSLDEPPKVSALAVTSALLGVVLSVAGFCLMPMGRAV